MNQAKDCCTVLPHSEERHNQDWRALVSGQDRQSISQINGIESEKMKMHVSEKNSDEQPEMFVSSNTKEFGPMGQLAALRAEFDEFKRASAEEKAGLLSERDAMAQKVDLLTKQVKEASMLGDWMLEVKNDEQSKESKDTECKTKEEENITAADSDFGESKENVLKSIPNFINGFDEGVRTQVADGAKILLDSVANQFDEDGYIKALLPGEGKSGGNLSIVLPTTKELVSACDVVKNHVEDGAQQVLASVADQFDEEGYIKVLLPGEEEVGEINMPALPTTKELIDACDTVKNHVEGGAQQVLVSVADNFDENGFMKCCLSQE